MASVGAKGKHLVVFTIMFADYLLKCLRIVTFLNGLAANKLAIGVTLDHGLVSVRSAANT
jgi:hypothetical protein